MSDHWQALDVPLALDPQHIIDRMQALLTELDETPLPDDPDKSLSSGPEYKYKTGTLLHWMEAIMAAGEFWKVTENDNYLNVIVPAVQRLRERVQPRYQRRHVTGLRSCNRCIISRCPSSRITKPSCATCSTWKLRLNPSARAHPSPETDSPDSGYHHTDTDRGAACSHPCFCLYGSGLHQRASDAVSSGTGTLYSTVSMLRRM